MAAYLACRGSTRHAHASNRGLQPGRAQWIGQPKASAQTSPLEQMFTSLSSTSQQTSKRGQVREHFSILEQTGDIVQLRELTLASGYGCLKDQSQQKSIPNEASGTARQDGRRIRRG